MAIAKMGKLVEVDIRKLWEHEQYDFSKWLSDKENLELLNDAIGLSLTEVETEVYVGAYRCDLVGKDEVTGEKKEMELLAKHKVNFIVLARYMQVISEKMIDAYPNRIINIHHSFLPAFVGAKPYHAAFERGVKIIGATSHYVTTELDAGPIIEQDVVRITHKDTVQDLVNKGKDLEKIVLSRAVQKHIERKVLAYKNKTVIFN